MAGQSLSTAKADTHMEMQCIMFHAAREITHITHEGEHELTCTLVACWDEYYILLKTACCVVLNVARCVECFMLC